MDAMEISKLTTEDINRLSMQQGMKALDQFRDEVAPNAMERNRALLLKLISDNRDTEFGRKYDFASIHSVEEYQKRVPVSTYDDYAGYVHRMLYQDAQKLFTAYKIPLYCKSSGTLGNPKILPMTDASIAVQTRYNLAINNGLHALANEKWAKGRSLFLIESSMATTKNGKTFGCLSAIMMQQMQGILGKISATPLEAIFPVGDTDTRYLQARFGMMERGLTRLNCTFLSYAVEILRYIESNWQMLVDDIEKGSINEAIRMPDEVRQSLLERIQPMPERAEELRRAFAEEGDKPLTRRIWKDLCLIDGVGTGSFEVYDAKLKERYVDSDVQFLYSGLSATEGLFSVPLDLNSKDSALVPDSVFYEFLPTDAGDDFSKIVTMDQVEVGKDYELIFTSLSGLYRYRLRDVVRVMGRYKELPLIRYQYRLDQTVDLLDDHTREVAFINAAMETAKELDFDLVDFSVFPDRDAFPPRYVYLLEIGKCPENLSLEEIRASLDRNLCKNAAILIDYCKKGKTAPTELHLLQEETYMLYRDLMIMKGRNPAQIKPVHIIKNELHRRFFFGLIDRELEEQRNA